MTGRPWFREWRWLYRPVSWRGWVFTILIAAFCYNIFVAVDRRAHSASDTLYGAFPYILPALLLWEFVARKTGEKKDHTDAAR